LIVSVLVALAALIPVVRVGDVPGARRAAAMPLRASAVSLRPFAGLIFAALLNHAAVASARVFYPAYLDRVFMLPTSLIGLIASIGTLLAVVGSLSGPRVIGPRGSGFGMIVASLGLTASLLLMGLLDNWLAAAIGTIGTLALIGLWTLAYQVLQMEMAAPAQRSVVAGVGWMGMSLGFTLMSFAGGQIVTAYGYQPLFLSGAVLSATSAIVMWRITRRVVGLQPFNPK
jgi:predicted MFS family arabinose efflux permease